MRLHLTHQWAGLVVALLFPVWACAQTTQPVAPSAEAETPTWTQKLNDLSDRLAGHDIDALQAQLQPTTVVRKFNSDKNLPPARLLAATTRSKVIASHAYNETPTTLASDVAASVRMCIDDVPEPVQRELIPQDESAEKRANTTASQWVAQVLQPSSDQPIGVLVFWPAVDKRTPNDAAKRRPIFVLVKAQLVEGGFAITQISFGDPLETPR